MHLHIRLPANHKPTSMGCKFAPRDFKELLELIVRCCSLFGACSPCHIEPAYRTRSMTCWNARNSCKGAASGYLRIEPIRFMSIDNSFRWVKNRRTPIGYRVFHVRVPSCGSRHGLVLVIDWLGLLSRLCLFTEQVTVNSTYMVIFRSIQMRLDISPKGS